MSAWSQLWSHFFVLPPPKKKFLYYPLYIDITSSNTPQMKIKAVSQWTARFNIEKKPKNVGVYLEISLLDCLTKKIPGFFQDYSYSFPRLYNSLPVECFPLTYDLSGFKSIINRHILTVGSFWTDFLYPVVFFVLFFLVTPYIVVAVLPCMGWIPI